MGQSPSSKAASFLASQEILCILWHPKVHCHIHNSCQFSLSYARPIQSTPVLFLYHPFWCYLFALCLFVCLFACLFVCLLVCWFACLLVCLFACLFVCLLISVFLSCFPSSFLASSYYKFSFIVQSVLWLCRP